MTSGTYFEFNDTCPVHDTEIRKEYDFGQGDATVYTFSGCRCAACCDAERGWYQGTSYYTSYSQAAGKARLITAGNSVDDARVS